MKQIAVVTVARSDFGILTPILRDIARHPELSLRLLVSGAHLSPEFGRSVDDIVEQGFHIDEIIPSLICGDSPQAVALSIGLGVMGFARSFSETRPDILLILGDRFEMFASAVAALPLGIPLAHVHGGERTEGAIDEALRHSMTKMSHLHFVTTDEYAARVRQLGEESWRIFVTGAPALDQLRESVPIPPEELERRFGISLTPPPLLVTFHPVTLEYEQTGEQTRELLEALDVVNMPVVFTLPNADTMGRTIVDLMRQFHLNHAERSWIVPNFGSAAYFSVLRYVAAMVGNSSSGLIEAGSVGLPVVNVGDRQRGRVRGENVIDVPTEREAIVQGIRRALAPQFKDQVCSLKNPYDAGSPAARIIADALAGIEIDDRLVKKRFMDL